MCKNKKYTAQSRVFAVIVAFNPDETIIQSVTRLVPQVVKIVIVDNGSSGNGKNLVGACCQISPLVEVLWNRQNIGIAQALNQGVALSLELGADWILTLDHDSVVGADYIQQMLETYNHCCTHHKMRNPGIIVPMYIYKDKSVEESKSQNTSVGGYRWLREAITSGNLVRADVFRDAGFYRAQMFIDYVDFEFCHRIRSRGFEILEAGKATLMHAMGNVQTKFVLGISVVYTTYSPERRYYKSRNRVWCCKMYLFGDPYWVFKDLFLLTCEIFKIVLTEESWRIHLRYVCRGIIDGLRGREGRLTT